MQIAHLSWIVLFAFSVLSLMVPKGFPDLSDQESISSTPQSPYIIQATAQAHSALFLQEDWNDSLVDGTDYNPMLLNSVPLMDTAGTEGLAGREFSNADANKFLRPVITVSENLAPNPSFEYGSSSVSGWYPILYKGNVSFLWDDSVSHSGSRSIGIGDFEIGPCYNPGEECAYGSWESTELIPFDPSHDYEVSVWYLNKSNTSNVKFFLIFWGANPWPLGSGKLYLMPPNSGWSHHRYTWYSDDYPDPFHNAVGVTLGFLASSRTSHDGTVWIDDVSLVDLTADETYNISGRISDTEGAGVSGVTVSDGFGHAFETDAHGLYGFLGLESNTYFIQPSKPGFVFDPVNRLVSVPPSREDVYFTAYDDIFNISGQVKDIDGNSLQGVQISAGYNHSFMTNEQGEYGFLGLDAGTYTISPFKSGYVFEPRTAEVTYPPNIENSVDFVARPTHEISHIEITQAIQDETNSIPLIIGKPTAVRVYVRCREECDSPWVVTGEIDVLGENDTLLGQVTPTNSIFASDTTGWHTDRADLSKTLNFLIDSEWHEDARRLRAKIPGVEQTIDIEFLPTKTLRIVYVPIEYRGVHPGEQNNLIPVGAEMADAVLPVTNLLYQQGVSLVWNDCLGDDCGSEDNSDLISKLALIAELKSLYPDPNFLVFGWLPENTINGGFADFPPPFGDNKAAIADAHPTEGKRFFTHEVGHLLGREHLGTDDCPFGEAFTPDWPYETAKIQETGIRILTNVSGLPISLYQPNSSWDYMSYCGTLSNNDVWTAPFTYEKIYQESLQLAEFNGSSLNPNSVPLQIQYISGMVYANGTASLFPLWPSEPDTDEGGNLVGNDYCVNVEDDSLAVLYSTCFDLIFVNRESGTQSQMATFSVPIPYFPETARIVLSHNNSILAELKKTGHPPSVTLLSPNGGEVWMNKGQYTLEWESSDEDGDELFFRVQYSRDGETWIPISGTVKDTTVIVEAGELPGSESARMRVIASDGFLNTIDQVDDVFSVGKKAPRPHILTSEDEISVVAGTPLFLLGNGNDREDGEVTNQDLIWSSNIDGLLGYGRQLLVRLSPGQHTISLSASDSDGNVARTSIQVDGGQYLFLPKINNQ